MQIQLSDINYISLKTKREKKFKNLILKFKNLILKFYILRIFVILQNCTPD